MVTSTCFKHVVLYEFLSFVNQNLHNHLKTAPNWFRTTLARLRKPQLKLIASHINNILANHPFEQWISMIIDIIDTKLYRPLPTKKRKPRPKFRMDIRFSSKAFDFINLPKLLRHRDVLDVISNSPDLTEEDIPSVVYTLTDPIRRKIFNYNKFVASLDLDQAHNNIDSIPCYCSSFDPKYKDPVHQHILTGDLSIINNSFLQSLLLKGPKYREPEKINFEEAYDRINLALENLIDTYACNKKKPKHVFYEWKYKVLEVLSAKISTIQSTFQEHRLGKRLKDPDIKAHLESLHDKFVFCPLDKAGNNVSIVCKRLYAKQIIQELDLDNIDNPSTSNTYIRADKDEDTILREHLDFHKRFHLPLDEEMRKLPPMHWTPKMHKDPTGARFIIGSKLSSLKPLGKAMTKIFKVIFHHKRRYYRKAGFYAGVKYFWCIESHKELIGTLERLNSKNMAKSIETFDFSTLYTKIPHGKLIDTLSEIIDSTFNDTDRSLISVSNKRAYFVKSVTGKNFKFSSSMVKECLKFLIDNAYFQVGNHIFKQTIGIPIGSDPAPFFANLFLAYYEAKWVKENVNRNYALVKRLFNNSRYIDDLITLNDDSSFSQNISEIYPPELVLNKENTSTTSASYLDLDITIVNNKFQYQLYDKRNAFPFKIVRFPFKSSNIPQRMFFATVQAEIIRISRATSLFDHFLASCKPFLLRITNQGARKSDLNKPVTNIINSHQSELTKFHSNKDHIRREIMKLI